MPATKPTTIAINEGIGAYVQDLGFRRKSARLYLKETGDYEEFVWFRIRNHGQVIEDIYGVFDRAFQDFCDDILPEPFDSGMPLDYPRPAHVLYGAGPYANGQKHRDRTLLGAGARALHHLGLRHDAERAARPPYKRFVDDQGHWVPGDAPEACAAAMRCFWRDLVETARGELLATPKAVIQSEIDKSSFFQPIEFTLASAAYVGNIDFLKEKLAYYSNEAITVIEEEIQKRAKQYKWTKVDIDESRAISQKSILEHGNLVRHILDKIQI